MLWNETIRLHSLLSLSSFKQIHFKSSCLKNFHLPFPNTITSSASDNMKGTLITLFALAAAPALASGLSKNTGGKSIYVGYAPLNEITVGESVATGSVAGRAAALADSKLATRATAAEFFCQLPTRDVSGAPANAANIDGMPAYSPSLGI